MRRLTTFAASAVVALGVLTGCASEAPAPKASPSFDRKSEEERDWRSLVQWTSAPHRLSICDAAGKGGEPEILALIKREAYLTTHAGAARDAPRWVKWCSNKG
ncbi:hypothetical protein [Streptomyces sp. NPDC101393]|uniref:hypothetical protein n=1 Tax=Streptomyces sp. NPDC101393 TaxID=3366141 RepID=UPI00382F22C2